MKGIRDTEIFVNTPALYNISAGSKKIKAHWKEQTSINRFKHAWKYQKMKS